MKPPFSSMDAVIVKVQKYFNLRFMKTDSKFVTGSLMRASPMKGMHTLTIIFEMFDHFWYC